MHFPRTLFARTVLTLALAFLLLLSISAAIFSHYVLRPTTLQASEDAAALFVLAAQTWAELPPDTREDFQEELMFSHGISLSETNTSLPELEFAGPYLGSLKEALEVRLETTVGMSQNLEEDNVYLVDLPVGGRVLRIEFERERYIPDMPYAILVMVLLVALVIFITTLLLMKHLTRPLADLSHAALLFGRGESPDKLPETGAAEMKSLNKQFNLMMGQITELLANRTTLLAGISHDLKTPIARLSLALEMLPEDADLVLMQQMRKDLKEMDELITRTLHLARNLDSHEGEMDEVNLPELLDGLVSELSSAERPIVWQPQESCLLKVNTVALRRVVGNLLENSLRYGESEQQLTYFCGDKSIVIEVIDRGEGVPEEKLEMVFQPFYRLEASRNVATGGSGLGLAIVQQLCHANGWQIKLKSRIGGGLKAQLELPALRNNNFE